MTKTKFFSVWLIISAIMFLPVNLSSQVTIGSADTPQSFSVLELISSDRGLRLPQIANNAERDRLFTYNREFNENPLAMGLLIFNLNTRCLELWDGKDWISLCVGETPDPCAGLEIMDTFFCAPFTIDQLTERAREAGGRGDIQWFLTDGTGGDRPIEMRYYENGGDDTPIPPGTPFEAGFHTFWADNCADTRGREPENINMEIRNRRVPVTIEIDPCVPASSYRLTAFVNVLYDFQPQRLTVKSWTTPDNVQWLARAGSGGTWEKVADATNSTTFTLPPDFIHRRDFEGENYLYFKAEITNQHSDITETTNILQIRFIRTTVSGEGSGFLEGYGKNEETGVRYAIMNRAPHGGTGTSNPTIIRVALLNLGATDEYGDADDVGLGNLFQWGRRADGHEKIVWGKDPFSLDNIFAEGTSSVFDRNRPDMIFNAQGQVTNEPWLGNFIRITFADLNLDWSTGVYDTSTDLPLVGNRDLWGNGLPASSRENSPLSLVYWSVKAQANNPCYVLGAGWRVPSPAEWGDMHESDGITVGSNSSGFSSGTNGNTWIWRDTDSGAVGGIILTNNYSNVSIFLPAIGGRTDVSGDFTGSGWFGGTYWSSSFGIWWEEQGMNLQINSHGVNAGTGANHRGDGYAVRCVQ